MTELEELRKQLDAATKLATAAHGDAIAVKAAVLGTETHDGLRYLYGALATDVRIIRDQLEKGEETTRQLLIAVTTCKTNPLVYVLGIGALLLIAGASVSSGAGLLWWIAHQSSVSQM